MIERRTLSNHEELLESHYRQYWRQALAISFTRKGKKKWPQKPSQKRLQLWPQKCQKKWQKSRQEKTNENKTSNECGWAGAYFCLFSVRTISIRRVKIESCDRLATDGATRHVLVASLAQENSSVIFVIKGHLLSLWVTILELLFFNHETYSVVLCLGSVTLLEISHRPWKDKAWYLRFHRTLGRSFWMRKLLLYSVFTVKLLKLTDYSSLNPFPKIIDELKMLR